MKLSAWENVSTGDNPWSDSASDPYGDSHSDLDRMKAIKRQISRSRSGSLPP